MCRVLEVSRSGFYRYINASPSQRKKGWIKLDTYIQSEYLKHKQRYGSRRIARVLRKNGVSVSDSLIARRMKSLGLKAKGGRKYCVTTNSKHKLPIANNLLKRDFNTQYINQVWVTDITYI
ncbi:MAG: putative transposase [Lysobacterales bacterium]|jgi:putative transposase